MTTTTSIPVGRAALRRTNVPSTLPINRDVSAVPIDNDPLMAGIDVPNPRTINLIGPVSQAGTMATVNTWCQIARPPRLLARSATPIRVGWCWGVIDICAIVLRFTLRIGEDDSAINRV